MTTIERHVEHAWRTDITPALVEYIRIPNVSPAYAPDWEAQGHMARAVEMVRSWCAARAISGLQVDVVQLPGRTPLIVCEVPASPGVDRTDTVLLYGHLDKQPEMDGWWEGFGPWTPVIQDGRLYGRGGGDDGYAAYSSLTAIEAIEASGATHGRLIVLIEASEESGSPDLPAYLDHLSDRLGDVRLVVCLDSGAGDYERLWLTTSLRGLVGCTLTVRVLREGVHSGIASGVVPSSFRIVRQLLDRVEDAVTGRVLVPEMHVDIPAHRLEDAKATTELFGVPVAEHFPFLDGVRPMVDDPLEQMLNHTWRPTLSYTGASGLPAPSNAGNVLRPYTSMKLSFRVPPTADAPAAAAAVERILTADPPSGAHVAVSELEHGSGWDAPDLAPWLGDALRESSERRWGAPMGTLFEGGSIPFMAMLGQRFPRAQFVITGVLGPGNNAHGPNEFIYLPSAEKITSVIADVLVAHAHSPA